VERVAMIASAIVKRIQFPAKKAKGKDGLVKQAGQVRELSTVDIEETLSIVASTLATRDAFTRDLTRDDWNQCFRDVRGIYGLQLDRRNLFRECDLAGDDGKAFDLSRCDEDFRALVSRGKRDRKAIARRYAYYSDAIAMAFSRDESRKRVSKVKRAMEILELAQRVALGIDTGSNEFPPAWVPADFSQEARDKAKAARGMAKRWFLSYVREGENALND